MTANDTATRRVTTWIVLVVGLFAGSDSYSHIYTLARDHGQDIASAALLPLAGDGLIAAASSAMLVASRQGRDVPVLARAMLLAGIGATIAANVGYGLHAGITGALLSVWPVAAYVGCMDSHRPRTPAARSHLRTHGPYPPPPPPPAPPRSPPARPSPKKPYTHTYGRFPTQPQVPPPPPSRRSSPPFSLLRLDATPAVRRTTAPAVRRGRSR